MKEIVSNIRDPGKKTKAEIERVDLSSSTEESRLSKDHIKKSGLLLSTPSFMYAGSATVHYYTHVLDPQKFQFVTVVNTEKINEHMADFGWKELRKSLMKNFGHEDEKKR